MGKCAHCGADEGNLLTIEHAARLADFGKYDTGNMTRMDLIAEVKHLRFMRALAYGIFVAQLFGLLGWWAWSLISNIQ